MKDSNFHSMKKSRLTYLRGLCYKNINKIVYLGEISRQDLITALAIRMKIKYKDCQIDKFDELLCEKALKALEDIIYDIEDMCHTKESM